MKIDKIINNNLIRTFDNNGKEILLMGCGLGFQKKIGDTIDRSKIEKIYAIENKNDSNKLMNLLSEIPLEYIQVSNEIISYAKYSLGKRLKCAEKVKKYILKEFNHEISDEKMMYLTVHIKRIVKKD